MAAGGSSRWRHAIEKKTICQKKREKGIKGEGAKEVCPPLLQERNFILIQQFTKSILKIRCC